MALNGRLLVSVVVVLAGCGDGGRGKDDAAVADGAAADGAVDSVVADVTGPDAPCSMVDHPTFWPTVCAAADTCGWLAGGHAELEHDEASCNTRHASDPDPSGQLSYLAGFETRIHAAAACLGCQALVDAYFRPDLETVFCTHIARCGGNETTCRAQYRMDAMRPGSDARFDYACPRYCIEQLAADASCAMVTTCLMACN
jgi:hypothetical protein